MPGPASSTTSSAPCALLSTRTCTAVPGGEWRTALSTRLRTSTSKEAASPCSGTGASACSSSSLPCVKACGTVSASARRAISARSAAAKGKAGAPGSLRARASSCSTNQAARVMPSPSACVAALRAASSGEWCSSCNCSFSAVSGERNSCAASATKARCTSSVCPRRCSRPFSACTKGANSSGRPSPGSGANDCVSRSRTACATCCSGRSVSVASHHISKAKAGATTSSGWMLWSAASAASRWRIWRGCATWITRRPVATLKVRQALSPTVTSARPR